MHSFDLIPFPESIRSLFILESPHTKELIKGYPCAGDTGHAMSENILFSSEFAFGKLLYSKDHSIKEFGVFNSFHFPIGIPDKLTETEKEISSITNYKYVDYGSRKEFYKILID